MAVFAVTVEQLLIFCTYYNLDYVLNNVGRKRRLRAQQVLSEQRPHLHEGDSTWVQDP